MLLYCHTDMVAFRLYRNILSNLKPFPLLSSSISWYFTCLVIKLDLVHSSFCFN